MTRIHTQITKTCTRFPPIPWRRTLAPKTTRQILLIAARRRRTVAPRPGSAALHLASPGCGGLHFSSPVDRALVLSSEFARTKHQPWGIRRRQRRRITSMASAILHAGEDARPPPSPPPPLSHEDARGNERAMVCGDSNRLQEQVRERAAFYLQLGRQSAPLTRRKQF